MYLRICAVLLVVSGLGKAHFDHGLNLALQGRATQSSLESFLGNAVNAVDGNPSTDCRLGTCSITAMEWEPWWRVDLLCSYRVTTVSITSRGDHHTGRLNGAEIRIGDSLADNGRTNARCGRVETIGPGETLSFSCNGMQGRHVTVLIPGRQESLELAEVTVFGTVDPHCGEGAAH